MWVILASSKVFFDNVTLLGDLVFPHEKKSDSNGKLISKYIAKLTFELNFSSSFLLDRNICNIAIQSNHLPGNPRYTLMEHLLADLTDF